MKDNKTIHGFRVERETHINEIGAPLIEMLHERSGARLLFLNRQDDNKTFAIGFKTTPTDDTGVFHIIEHSVLCGSEKFPLKDPFSELIKGSVSTYLNALTYSDKTLYPVSSKNDKAFLGLIDVYLDAVLHPNAISNPYIFMQEGHRYEMDGEGRLGINGVVYNEMKGAYSSVDDYADYHLTRLIAPGSTYSYDSGGNPDFIPTLTFEDFKAAHEKFYHPSNSYIFLDGSVKLDEVLALIDGYLSAYERRYDLPTAEIGGEVITEPLVIDYPAESDDGVKDKNRIYLSHNSFPHSQREKNVALALACEAIADSNNAPLTKAILASELCESFHFYSTRSYDVNALNVTFFGVKDGREGELIELYTDAVRKIAEAGIPKDNLSASLDRMEFSTREADYGSYPKGMVYMSSCMEWAFHGDSPADALVYDNLFKSLREKIDTDYYDSLVREVLATPRATLILHPDETFTEKKEAELRASLDRRQSEMSEEERDELIRTNEKFALWQNEPSTEEALATIPRLTIPDLSTEVKKTPVSVGEISGVRVISHAIPTSGISYPELFFDVSDIAPEDIPYLRLFAELLSEWSTERGDVTYFRNRSKRNLGMFYSVVIPIKHGSEPKLYLTTALSCLDSKKEIAAELLEEHLYSTLFNDKSLLKKNIKQAYAASVENIISRGESLAMMRDAAKHSLYDALSESLYGYTYHRFIKELSETVDNRADNVLAKLEEIRDKYLRRERLTVGITEDDGSGFARLLISKIRTGGQGAGACKIKTLPMINEGVAIPAPISYCARTSNLYKNPENSYTGAFATLTNIMSYELLWNEIRVKGGAYDTGFFARSNSGTLGCYSYRDPSPSRSAEIFADIPALLRDFLNTSPDLLKYVIGTVGASDTVSTPRSEGSASTKLCLSARTHEDVVKARRESIEVTPGELYRLADLLEDALCESTFTIVASREELEKNKDIKVILDI